MTAQYGAARGHVTVDAELRIRGERATFALGDCGDIAEPKMLKMAKDQATVVAGNIVRAIAGEPLEAHERFASRLTILPFGSRNGVALILTTIGARAGRAIG